ncbi:uncharacterized protein LOC121370985 [Gigantopelta aegis]|uniref:uncharacterized protein LOC121370985 n=1 Tax=Gigantopelta aegis TaxID=1735272 RepID=UPI001B88DAE3|nr:uncharacterized protein LOC121370985 [Gigantopelta aegis]
MSMDPTKDPILRRVAKKSKGYAKKMTKPDEQPTAVCFSMPGTELTHEAVWRQLEKDVLAQYPEVKVSSIKYVPRDLLIVRPKGADPIENRWVVSLSSDWGRKRITGMWLRFAERPVQLKCYDDVVGSEYRQFKRMKEYMKDFKIFEKKPKKKHKKR